MPGQPPQSSQKPSDPAEVETPGWQGFSLLLPEGSSSGTFRLGYTLPPRSCPGSSLQTLTLATPVASLLRGPRMPVERKGGEETILLLPALPAMPPSIHRAPG